MSRFYFGDSNSNSDDDDGDDTLPYPAPLQRNDFLAPDFSPSAYLSTLHNRHQTLEDLRSELRSRSQLLSKELLDLVNSNYQDFLGLGRSLKNGDEKVEEVRVGLLGFRKEVESVRTKVVEREEEVRQAVDERVEIRKKIAVGRALVDYDARLKVLEEQLVIETAGKDAADDGVEDSDSEEDSDEEEGGPYGVSISRLRKHVLQYRLVQEVEKGLGQHPFITAQAPRSMKVRNTLLLDLSTALQQAKSAGAFGYDRVMKVMKIYADMDESAEVVKVLKELSIKR
ncbi:oligomeric golgi complex component, COG2-domain-containing protein [Massariosphaeria phaeospora]|uniref:Conserved oligomeric Golgi complex subunit 2 n=1 Tax=Massariosphaeria phaeospora TaxID=100035 RepID=A0A7C8M4X7_9PLEO|nr:oligomeric golgi complex component, COG2-domain-containing protein [Massariosphaeria phaeospora]